MPATTKRVICKCGRPDFHTKELTGWTTREEAEAAAEEFRQVQSVLLNTDPLAPHRRVRVSRVFVKEAAQELWAIEILLNAVDGDAHVHVSPQQLKKGYIPYVSARWWGRGKIVCGDGRTDLCVGDICHLMRKPGRCGKAPNNTELLDIEASEAL